MKHAVLAAVMVGALSGCRTVIPPIVTEEAPKATVARTSGPTKCDVRDYDNATELPSGAKNLGFVQVPKEKTDEETYLKLRQAICDAGGDALSGLAWIKEVGDPEPTSLRANAWSLP
jgi:hypothetical protein